jgi:hypothetical protein
MTYPIHPANALFPAISDVDYTALRDDIAQHGVHNPIWLDTEGRLLDGQTRLRACTELGIDCPTQTYTGDDPISFVAAQNCHRRHLTTPQRAEIAARLSSLARGTNQYRVKKVEGPNEPSTPSAPRLEDLARVMRVGRTTVVRAKGRLRRKDSVAVTPRRTKGTPKKLLRAGKVIGRRPPTPVQRSQFEDAQQRRAERMRRTIAAIDHLAASGERLSDAAITQQVGLGAERFIRHAQFVPWVAIDRTPAGTRITIDPTLRDHCETWQPRPELPERSIAAALPLLLTTLRRERKENHDAVKAAKWEATAISKKKQSEQLDWIDTQLERLVRLLHLPPARLASPPAVPSSPRDDSMESPNGHPETAR